MLRIVVIKFINKIGTIFCPLRYKKTNLKINLFIWGPSFATYFFFQVLMPRVSTFKVKTFIVSGLQKYRLQCGIWIYYLLRVKFSHFTHDNRLIYCWSVCHCLSGLFRCKYLSHRKTIGIVLYWCVIERPVYSICDYNRDRIILDSNINKQSL